MPYTLNNLPNYVKNKPDTIKRKWIKIFNSVYEKEGEAVAFQVANKWLLRQGKTKLVAKTENSKTLEIVSFKLSGTEFISKTSEGDDFIEYTLADIYPDSQGHYYTPELLQKWAENINSNPIVGDIDHTEYNKWVESNLPTEEIIERIKNKPGIAKTIKAFFENGALKIRTFIDKRYRKLIALSNGVSLEAIVSVGANGKISDGKLLGFTFGINQLRANPRAVATA